MHELSQLLMTIGPLAYISWPLLSLATLAALRHRRLGPGLQALWALIILMIPVLGAAAFWLVQPGENS